MRRYLRWSKCSINRMTGFMQDRKRRNDTTQSTSSSFDVFAGMTVEAKTPLIFVPQGEEVNGEAYLGIFKNQVLPWAREHFVRSEWTFQQDVAPGHKSRNVQEFCRGAFPDFLAFDEWPPSSPD
ncbi:hypothetical protein V3C99_005923 [Haemonchus contortus]